jgi:hypothetical protein
LKHVESIHIIYRTFGTYRKVASDFSVFWGTSLLLGSLTDALWILHVLVVSVVRKTLVSTTIGTLVKCKRTRNIITYYLNTFLNCMYPSFGTSKESSTTALPF